MLSLQNNVYAAFTGDITGDATGLSGSPTITVTAVNVGTAATLSANGNVAFAGLATANGGVQVGTSATIFANGNAAFAGLAINPMVEFRSEHLPQFLLMVMLHLLE